MELRHLRTIAAVARHRSFTKAGEELHLAQSAISQQIRRLEHEIGVEVFHRTSRSVELTAEGRVILDYAHRVIAEVDGPALELAELTGLLRGQLRIGGVYPTGLYDLFGMLAEFRATHPEVAIHMVEDTQEDTIAALRADELDCAFTAAGPRHARRRVRRHAPLGGGVHGRDAGRPPAVRARVRDARGAGRAGPDRLPRELRPLPPAGAQAAGRAASRRARRSSARRWARCARSPARASAWR